MTEFNISGPYLFALYSTLMCTKIECMGINSKLEGNPRQAWLDATQEYLDEINKIAATNKPATDKQQALIDGAMQHIMRFSILFKAGTFK